MHIARIRQMASSGDMSINTLRYLLDCRGECEHLDFKEDIDLENDFKCAGFARDILGMKNVGGGYLVVGVQDKTWEHVGLQSSLPYDTKLLRDKVRKSTGLDIEVDIVHHELFVKNTLRIFPLILVRSTIKKSKLKVPSMAKTDFHQNENWGVRRGDIYARDGDSTKRIDSEFELERLLDDLETRYQEEELEEANATPSPFAVEQGLYRLLPREYESFVGRDKFKDQLREAIEGDPRLWIINLYGPGGVGKSALATWIAYEYYYQAAEFEAILHLSAKDLELSTEEGIRRLSPTLFSLEDFLDRVLRLFVHDEFRSADLDTRKETAIELLSVFRTLLILDNMETITDGRLMEFIRSLPPKSQTKVLLTSRRRTAEWEYPVQVTEFDEHEVRAFLEAKVAELNLDLPTEQSDFVQKIQTMSGGLPLAIQWILGEYSKTRHLSKILSRALTPDSPLLEFSFRNSWNVLDEAAQQALAVLSIFVDPPTEQEWRTALNWPVEKMERAINSLTESTFVSDRTESKTGKVVYSALPITLTFARNELSKIPGLEREARQRYQDYRNRMELATVETSQYESLFHKFEAKTDTQKRAIILCRMAEGQASSLGYDAARQYFKQSIELEPRSVYALVSYGVFEMNLGNSGEAIDLIKRATQYCSKGTGYYVYFSLARVYDSVRDRQNRVKCLRKALDYEPENVIARHSLGVALSQSGKHTEALNIFDKIIEDELSRAEGPGDSLGYAYQTKVITLRHAKQHEEARNVLQEAITVMSNLNYMQSYTRKLRSMLEE